MTALPTTGDFAALSLSESQFQTDLEALRAVICELIGGGNEQQLTLLSDAVQPANNDGCFLEIDTEASAANDDLKFITVSGGNVRDGHVFVVHSKSGSRVPRLFHNGSGAGKLLNQYNEHISLTDPTQWVMYKYDAVNTCYREILRSQNIDVNPAAGVSANFAFMGPTSGAAAKGVWRAFVIADFGTLLDGLPGWLPETTLTVSSNRITPTRNAHVMNTGSGAQELRGIIQSSTIDGQWLVLGISSASNSATVKNNYGGETNPILLRDGVDVTITKTNQYFLLRRTGTSWKEIARFGFHLDDVGIKAPSTIQISGDAIAITPDTAQIVKLTSETGSADDLKYIDTASMQDGRFALLRATAGHAITVRNNASGGTGSQRVIKTAGGIDRTLKDEQTMLVYLDGTTIREFEGSPPRPLSGIEYQTRFQRHDLNPVAGNTFAVAGHNTGATISATNTVTTWISGSALAGGGVFVAISTSTVATNVASVAWGSSAVSPSNGFLFTARVRTDATITLSRLWVGLFSANISGVDSTTSDTLAFRYSTNASDTTFKCVTVGSATQNTSDSGVTVATSTTYDLVIDGRQPGFIRFYVNGVLVQEMTSNLPTAASLQPRLYLTTLTGAARTVNVGHQTVELP